MQLSHDIMVCIYIYIRIATNRLYQYTNNQSTICVNFASSRKCSLDFAEPRQCHGFLLFQIFYDGGESIKLPFFKGRIGLKLVNYFSKNIEETGKHDMKKTHVLNTSWHLTFVFLMLCKCKFFWIQLGTLTLCSMKHKCQHSPPRRWKKWEVFCEPRDDKPRAGYSMAWWKSQIKQTEHDSNSSACLKDATIWKRMTTWKITVHCSSAPDMIENTTRIRTHMSQRYDPQLSIQKLCDDSPIHAQI